VPDFEVFAAFIPKLLGARVILDIHDIVPELYASKFNIDSRSWIVRSLMLLEKVAGSFSDHVIIANDLWKDRLVSRSVRPEKCTAMINYPDVTLFARQPRVKSSDKFVIIYPGTLSWHQGLDVAIKALAMIKDEAPQAELHIYGEGSEAGSLQRLTAQLGLKDKVLIRPFLPLEKVVDIMAQADLGVVPKRANSFGDEAFSTKTLEFMTLGVPIIISRTKVDQFYFSDSVVNFVEPDNVEKLANSMLALIKNKALRDRLVANALVFAKQNSWDVKKKIYIDIVDSLCRPRRSVCS
jgi:glycosyltransferase involved in cell wall biosynthesis